MHLTKFEEDMLAGKYTEGDQEAMKLLVAIGEALGADRMIEVNRVHTSLIHFASDIWYSDKMLKGGAKCRISPTSNPLYNLDYLKKAGFGDPCNEEEHLKTTREVFRQLGITPSYSCTPEIQQNVPRMGEHVAFAESSATPYVNAVLGARSNRESAKSSLASAITGRTPHYGFHLDENRWGDTLINVETEIKDDFDYHLLGYAAAQRMEPGIPVFANMPQTPLQEELVAFCAELATGGSIAMFHILGVTPEAKTMEMAFHGEKPKQTVTITEKDLKWAQDHLSKGTDKPVEFVVFGCPHYSIAQIIEVAAQLEGKKVHKDVDFWILASEATKILAKDMGLLDTIEKAGAHIIDNTCSDDSCWHKLYGGKSGVTDSVKAAYYTPRMDQNFTLKRRSECIEIAIRGGY
jgi:cis-L-3-hydroxyproline dehydratase